MTRRSDVADIGDCCLVEVVPGCKEISVLGGRGG